MKRTILFFAISYLSLAPFVRTITLPWESENQSMARQAIVDYANGVADLEEGIAADLETESFDAKKVDETMKKRIAELRGDAFKPVNSATDSMIDDQGKLGGSDAAEMFRERARGYRAAVGYSFDFGGSGTLLLIIAVLSIAVIYLAGVATYAYQHGDKKALAWIEEFGQWASAQAKEVKSLQKSAILEKMNAEWDAAQADYKAFMEMHEKRMAEIKQAKSEVEAATADHGVTLETSKAAT